MHVRLTSSHSLTVVGEGCWLIAEGTGRREKGKDREEGIEGGRRIVIALSCTVTPAVYSKHTLTEDFKLYNSTTGRYYTSRLMNCLASVTA